jgi:hypothetical protein
MAAIGQSGPDRLGGNLIIRKEIGMTRLKSIGLSAVLAGAVAVVVGSLGPWSHGGALSDHEVVNSTERHWMILAAIVLGMVAVVLAVVRERASVRLGWVQLAAWVHLALVVAVSMLDTSKKIGSSKPDLGGQLGWGIWLAVAGTITALVGTVVGSTNRAVFDSAT